jgi:signal peptidase II
MTRKFGFALAAAVFALDRLSKWWLLGPFGLDARGDVELLPFFKLTLVWNRGISLGLFQMEGEGGRIALIALTAAISLFVAVWLWRVGKPHLTAALGLVLGGALGNIWDRFQYGAVADFFHFHALGHSFYIFNVADAAISTGVTILLFDALLLWKKQNT